MSDIRSPFDIDPDRLDEEWLCQSRLSRAAGAREADARHEFNKAKARLKVVRAEVLLEVRADPHLFDLRDRPNAEEVDAAVELEDRVKAAVAAVNEAEHALDVATAEKFAVGVDRRESLRGLTDLAGMEWRNLEPPARARADVDEAAKRATRRGIPKGKGSR